MSRIWNPGPKMTKHILLIIFLIRSWGYFWGWSLAKVSFAYSIVWNKYVFFFLKSDVCGCFPGLARRNQFLLIVYWYLFLLVYSVLRKYSVQFYWDVFVKNKLIKTYIHPVSSNAHTRFLRFPMFLLFFLYAHIEVVVAFLVVNSLIFSS